MLSVRQPAVSLTSGVPLGPGTLASLRKSQDFTGEIYMQQPKKSSVPDTSKNAPLAESSILEHQRESAKRRPAFQSL